MRSIYLAEKHRAWPTCVNRGLDRYLAVLLLAVLQTSVDVGPRWIWPMLWRWRSDLPAFVFRGERNALA